MSWGRGGGWGGGNLWQWMWCPLALLSVIRQSLCLAFLIHSWILKWMWWTSEVNAEGRNGLEPVLISSQIEQSLYPPPPLRGELVFNIPGHAFWQGTPPQTTNGLQRLLRDTLMFLMSKLELNMPLGLQQLMSDMQKDLLLITGSLQGGKKIWCCPFEAFVHMSDHTMFDINTKSIRGVLVYSPWISS